MAAVSDIQSVLGFLRENGLAEAETALKEDILAKGDLGCVDFERFEFPMSPPPPPPVRIGVGYRRFEEGSDSSSDSSSDFVSMGSFKTDASSGFTNPYGIRSTTRLNSEPSSADFGTARDYYDSEILNDVNWYDVKDDDYLKPSYFGRPDFHACPSEDKFVTSSEEGMYEEPSGLNLVSEGFRSETDVTCLDKSCLNTDYVDNLKSKDCYHWGELVESEQGLKAGLAFRDESCDCSVPLCDSCTKLQESHGRKFENLQQHNTMEELNTIDSQLSCTAEAQSDYDFMLENKRNRNSIPSGGRHIENNLVTEEHKHESDVQLGIAEKSSSFRQNNEYERENGTEMAGQSNDPAGVGDGEECNTPNELKLYESYEDEYDVFNLRIIHRKNRTGFEENKDLPIVINATIAGRYYVTEYIGSAAFSKVVQAHDLHTGVDVCLKIIKNDKDFFDQSLDEIKLLKFVNKHDPCDEHHILRLYDYFYHQEHLFIVCELLRANLYEFLKYNQDSGGEVYFTLPRLQMITRQCLEALEYLHSLGIIHCDLKPENILIKSYSRCEIKVIDLGSSCFQTDNLCLYVQSRSYRAPEVILGSPYDQKVDIWSLGCILAELCSGDVLFPNEALVTLLIRMIGIFGPIDMEMLVKGQETHKYFTKDYEYLYHINEETGELVYLTPEESSLENHMKVSDTGFIDFVKYLLEMNPRRRPSAVEALQHPWLSHSYD